MTRVVNVHEAKTHLSRLLEEVAAGEEIILAKAGKPYARLSPLQKKGRKKRDKVELGFLRHLGPIDVSSLFEPLADEDLEAWEGKYSSPLG